MSINTEYFVYILSNAHRTVLYTGVTNDLERRCFEHKRKLIKGFTQKYNVDRLVYYEWFGEIDEAIAREKQIKAYSRSKKVRLIDGFNNNWKELYMDGIIKNHSDLITASARRSLSRLPNYSTSSFYAIWLLRDDIIFGIMGKKRRAAGTVLFFKINVNAGGSPLLPFSLPHTCHPDGIEPEPPRVR